MQVVGCAFEIGVFDLKTESGVAEITLSLSATLTLLETGSGVERLDDTRVTEVAPVRLVHRPFKQSPALDK